MATGLRWVTFFIPAALTATICIVPLPAAADQCGELRARISELDAQIAQDTIENSRRYRMQARDNYARAYNAICSGGGGGPSGGTTNLQRGAAAIGAFANILSTLDAIGKQQEAARLRAEQEAEAAQRLIENQRLIEQARRDAEALEKDRAAAAAAAKDLEKRMATANPWIESENTASSDNPFSAKGTPVFDPFKSSVTSAEGTLAPGHAPGNGNPPVSPFSPRSPENTGTTFKTDAEIEAICANTANPTICTLLAQDQRARSPAYQDWRAANRRETDKKLCEANKELDAAIDSYTLQTGRPSLDEISPKGGTPTEQRDRLRLRLARKIGC